MGGVQPVCGAEAGPAVRLFRRRNRELEQFDAFVATQQAEFEVMAILDPSLETAARSMRAAMEREGLPLLPSMLDGQP